MAKMTKAQRREAARAEAERLRLEQLHRAKRNRTIAVSGILAGIVVLAIVVVMIINGSKPKPTADGDVPSGINATNGAIVVGVGGIPGGGPNEGKPVVTVYSDFLCYWCGVFEDTHADNLAALAEAGEVTVEYVPLATQYPGVDIDSYSTRMASDAYVVAEQAPEQYWQFVRALIGWQANPVGVPSDDVIAEIGLSVGVPAEVTDQFATPAYLDFVSANTGTAAAFAENFPEALPNGLGTPFILVDGEPLLVNWTEPGQFEAVLVEAGADLAAIGG
jgi:hypothetical protein